MTVSWSLYLERRWHSLMHYSDIIPNQNLRYPWIWSFTTPIWQLSEELHFRMQLLEILNHKHCHKWLSMGGQKMPLMSPRTWRSISHMTPTVEDGLILQGEALLILESEWVQVIQQLHDGHQGITKMNLQAKNVINWPRMAKDIEWMINCCNTCQHFQARQCDLPLEKQVKMIKMKSNITFLIMCHHWHQH